MNWAQYAGHELGLDEVRAMSLKPKFWGWTPPPTEMFVAGSDDTIALRFLHGHSYEPVTRALWRKLCAGKFVADIGAHSGVFTLDAFKAGATKVFSAEPHAINYARLVMNVRKNGFPPDGLYYGAIGDSNRVGMLLVKGGLLRCFAGGRMDLKNTNGEEIPVRVSRLDAILPESMWADLRVVKIDAENWTQQVLRGMGQMLEHRPDLIIECTVPGMGEILRPFGYKFWTIWETGRIEEVEDLIPHNPNNNYNGTDDDCRNRFASVRGLP